ncbi:MAG: RNA polymerase sigma factor [Actinomycetota bacterium]
MAGDRGTAPRVPSTTSADAPDDLLAAAAAGDRRALELLLDRHADRIHAVCRRILGHSDDALDATQEAMIAVARGIGRFDGRSAFTTWLYRVATNAALDEGRRRGRRPQPVETLPEPRPTGSPIDAQVGARVDVDAALARLPEEFRVAVVLRDLCDLDYAEIAEALDVPPGTVRSRIARGRAQLAELLGNPGHAAERPTSEPLA